MSSFGSGSSTESRHERRWLAVAMGFDANFVRVVNASAVGAVVVFLFAEVNERWYEYLT
jgi:hypothetical protein